MNPRSTGILAIVAALLGGFIYFYEIGGEVERKAADQAEKLIFAGLEVESIEAISLQTQDGISARFGRSGGVWELLEPVRAPADAAALDAMTSVLIQLASEGEVAKPGALAQYGLDASAREVRFEVAGEAMGLRIGRSTPVGGNLYVTSFVGDRVSPRVAYVETFRLNAFNRNLADLRDRRIVPFEPSEATSLSLAWPGGEVDLAKRDGDWWMLSPVEERADEWTVRDLLSDLSFLRAQSFIDAEAGDEGESAVAGTIEEAMGDVALRVRLTAAGTSRTVTIGGAYDGGRIMRGPSGRFFGVAEERFEDFERSVSAYRFKTLSEFEVSSARRMILTFAPSDEGGGDRSSKEIHRVVLRLGESGWAAEERPVETDRIGEIAETLAQMRASTVVAEEMGPDELASLGLAPPLVRLRVESGQGTSPVPPLAEVAIGRLDDRRGYYAQRVGDSKVYLVGREIADSLPVSWAAFEAHFMEGAPAEVDDEYIPAEGESDAAEFGDDPLADFDIP
jgi:Domain of unknown function (DUF4340)